MYMLPEFIINFLSSDNAGRPHFATQHEGSLQVPIPCAVVNVVFITILIIALIAVSGESALHEFTESLLLAFTSS